MWNVLIFDSGSARGSLTVLVFEGETGGCVEANASVEDTEANDRDTAADLNAGRVAAKSRDVEVRRAAIAMLFR